MTAAIDSFIQYFEIGRDTFTLRLFSIGGDIIFTDLLEEFRLVSIDIRAEGCDEEVLFVFGPLYIIGDQGFYLNLF